MPKYTNSIHTRGVKFVEIDGITYKKTGRVRPLNSVPWVPDANVKRLYVDSCSAADFGEQVLSNGGTVTIPSTQTDFQFKFDSSNVGDTGTVKLSSPQGTCDVVVAVGATGNTVWDTGSNGAPNNVEFTNIGQTLTYTDCNNYEYAIRYAAKGSTIFNIKNQGRGAGSGGGGTSGGGTSGGGGTTYTTQTWEYVLSLADNNGQLEYVHEGTLPGDGNAGWNLTTTITAGDCIEFSVSNDALSGSYMRFQSISAEGQSLPYYNGDYFPNPFETFDSTVNWGGIDPSEFTYTTQLCTFSDGAGGTFESQIAKFTPQKPGKWEYTNSGNDVVGSNANAKGILNVVAKPTGTSAPSGAVFPNISGGPPTITFSHQSSPTGASGETGYITVSSNWDGGPDSELAYNVGDVLFTGLSATRGSLYINLQKGAHHGYIIRNEFFNETLIWEEGSSSQHVSVPPGGQVTFDADTAFVGRTYPVDFQFKFTGDPTIENLYGYVVYYPSHAAPFDVSTAPYYNGGNIY